MNEQLFIRVYPYRDYIEVGRLTPDGTGWNLVASGGTVDQALREAAKNLGRPVLVPIEARGA